MKYLVIIVAENSFQSIILRVHNVSYTIINH